MNKDNIRPCPFCGRKAKLKRGATPCYGKRLYKIVCNSLKCVVNPRTREYNSQGYRMTREEVIAAWNGPAKELTTTYEFNSILQSLNEN
jgi:hypothetical protein